MNDGLFDLKLLKGQVIHIIEGYIFLLYTIRCQFKLSEILKKLSGDSGEVNPQKGIDDGSFDQLRVNQKKQVGKDSIKSIDSGDRGCKQYN